MEQISDTPLTDGNPVTGVCEGRMVAYWPADYDVTNGMKAVGSGGYIVGVITASWTNGLAVAMPCVNLRLLPDGNIDPTLSTFRSSATYSCQPAKGCWTWIPKA